MSSGLSFLLSSQNYATRKTYALFCSGMVITKLLLQVFDEGMCQKWSLFFLDTRNYHKPPFLSAGYRGLHVVNTKGKQKTFCCRHHCFPNSSYAGQHAPTVERWKLPAGWRYGRANEYHNSALDTSGMFSSLYVKVSASFVWAIFNFHSQAVDVKRKRRLYFDPLNSKERKMNGSNRLCSLIAEIRYDSLKAHLHPKDGRLFLFWNAPLFIRVIWLVARIQAWISCKAQKVITALISFWLKVGL